ncbi:MAG: DUF6165 family protein [Thiobacillus sp.]|nr:DUF6165 family protein [Thiobacillus sp.]
MIEVSYGELFDKISILEIKSAQVTDPLKLANISLELSRLLEVLRIQIQADEGIDDLSAQLHQINKALWVVEDQLRDKERDKQFDEAFVELARSVYKLNDERARLKLELNTRLGSRIVEEKNYRAY